MVVTRIRDWLDLELASVTATDVNAESLHTESVNNKPQVIGGDDTTADIQAKIDSLPDRSEDGRTGGGRVDLDNYVYDGLGTVTLGNRDKLVGQGFESTHLIQGSGIDDNVIEYIGDGERAFVGELREMRIDGDKDNNTAGHAIYTGNLNGGEANDFHANRVIVFDAPEDGFHADYVWGYHIDHSLFENCANNGMDLNGGSQFYLSDIFSAYNENHGVRVAGTCHMGKLDGVQSRNNGNAGFLILGNGNRLVGCFANLNGLYGYRIIGNRTTLTNCHARNNSTDSSGNEGLRIAGSSVTVNGGWFYDDRSSSNKTQSIGIRVAGGATDAELNGVGAMGNVQYGVSINETDATITGGVFSDNDYGIAIFDNNCHVWGATAIGNATDDVYVGGTDCVLYGNFGTVDDSGTRSIINGRATNSGDPSAGNGDWAGNAARAYEYDATVWDTSTSPPTPYKAGPNGNWHAI